jgi:tRNA pseudouridine13 synthase
MMSSDGSTADEQQAQPGVLRDLDPHVTPRVYATAHLAPIGGQLKQRPEDFLVDELPAYQPCGSGEHLYLLVQKRGMSTMEMIRVLADHFRVRPDRVGYAGLKDKHAITRQVVSIHIPGKKPEDFPMLEHDKIAILWTDLHSNKLRPGHLRGNRFSVRIRNVKPTDVIIAQRVLKTLQAHGVPNRFGEQRFGMLMNNHLIGRHLIAGDYDAAVQELLGPNAAFPEFNKEARAHFASGNFNEAKRHYPDAARTELKVLHRLSQGRDPRAAIRALDETTIGYYLSAFQSAVFNAVLDARVLAGTLGTLRPGDLAIKRENLAVFAVDEAVAQDPTTQSRLQALDIGPSGPMWGPEMMRAGGETDRREVACLAALGLVPEQLASADLLTRRAMEGKRRPLRIPLIDPEVEGGVDEHGAYVRCAFELPRGAFATVVMREIMKPPLDGGYGGAELEET